MELVSQTFFILTSALSIMLGVWVFWADKKSKKNQFFFATSLTIFLWIVFGYIGLNYLEISKIFLRLNFAAVSIFFTATYFFSMYFPSVTKSNKLVNSLIVLITALFAVVSLSTNLIIADATVVDGNIGYIMGDYEYIFYAFVLFLTLLIFNNLIRNYFSGDKQSKNNVKIFLVGAIIFAVLNIIFNVIAPNLVRDKNIYARLGDYSAIFFLSFAAYATVKHSLFNIKVVTTEVIVLFLSVALFVQIFVSNSFAESMIEAVVWLAATYGGWLLIKSVKKEIEQREQIEKLAKDLGKANEELKVLDKAKDDFLSMASHELNTPIAAIEGYLSMIIDEGIGEKLGNTTKKYLERVYSSAKRLSGLVSDLLNVSRIESGRIHLVYSEGQIEDTIEQSIAEIKPEVDKFKHVLTFHKPKIAMPKTYYDVPRITEAVINIVGNAAKYTPEGGKVDVSVEKNEDNIKVSIADNGKGIPADKKDKVFDKFTQADILKDEVKGTGLGLYIVKNFIEMHKGKVWFDSVVDKGTTFYFTIPILKTQPPDPHEGQGAVLH